MNILRDRRFRPRRRSDRSTPESRRWGRRTDRRNMLIPKPGIRSEFIPPGGQQQGCKIDASNHAALGLSKP